MSSERASNRPAHLRLRDALAQRIAAGEWGAGKLLPSESALAREFRVSCSTVRAALDILECERVVMRKRGHGTFVADADCSKPSSGAGRGEQTLRLSGKMVPGGLTEGLADRAERARLRLLSSDRVYRIHRLRIAKGKPVMAETVSLPAALFPGLAERAALANRIVDLAKAYGLRLGQAQERISISIASPVAAAALGLGEGSSVLVLDRVVLTRDGCPAEWRVAECVLTPENGSAIIALADDPSC